MIGSAMYKYNAEWTLEIYQNHANETHRGQMYIHHTPAHELYRRACDVGGRWVHGSSDDACNCGVRYPKTLWSRVKILDVVRKRQIARLTGLLV